MRLYRARRRARLQWISLLGIIGGTLAAWHFGWLRIEVWMPLAERDRAPQGAPAGDEVVSAAVWSDPAANAERGVDHAVFVARAEPSPDRDPFSGAHPVESPPTLTPSRRAAALQWDDPPPPVMPQNITAVAEAPAASPAERAAPTPFPSGPEPALELRPDRIAVPEAGLQPDAGNVDLTEIDLLIAAGKDLEAHRELSRLYWERSAVRTRIQERIDTTARRIFFSPQPHYTQPHVVQPGEQLRIIARNYQVPWQYLSKLNRVDPRKIRPSQKLKVLRGPFAAFVDLSEFELIVHAHGYYVKRYPIGIGKEGSTPVGRFTVQSKLEDPTYYGPDGEVIANDDPNNPLGERWIDIGDSYGIHGTIDANSIGKAVSRGCIRMSGEDVEEVFDMLDVGSEVVVRR